MNIMQDFIPLGSINRPERTNSKEFITIHNTGNPKAGANAKAHARYLKGCTTKTSWHYTVDDKDVYQHLPDDECAYHTGDGFGLTSGNRRSIGIEICMNEDGDLLKATDNAAKLVRYLMDKHNIPVENIVQHNKWSGKNCPQMIREGKPYSWEMFISKVRPIEEEKEMKKYTNIDEVPEWYRGAIQKMIDGGILAGTGNGLDLSEEMARIFTLIDRMGILDFFLKGGANNAKQIEK